MDKTSFSIKINAGREKVWKVLWDDETYRIWTGVFSEDGSYAESDWNEGSKVLFLTDKGDGMVSLIAKKTLFEFMSFKHLGSISKGVEKPFGDEMKTWEDTFENYSLKDVDGTTELIVEMDTVDEYRDFFNEKFPVALEKVKELSEKN